MSQSPEFEGAERRQHRMFVTRNTEYHFRGETCVAVRDRKTGQFRVGHMALRRELTTPVRFGAAGAPFPSLEDPEVGDALYFGAGGRELLTSVLTAIERPPKALVTAYPV